MEMGSLRKTILKNTLRLLRQGITPEKIAISMAFGTVIGIFPVMGSTTILCTFAALVFRLNLPAIQIINYVVYPLQIFMLIPFVRLGDSLMRAQTAHLSAHQLVDFFRAGSWTAIHALGEAILHAALAWVVVGPPLCLALYLAFHSLLKRLHFEKESSPESP